MMRNISHICPIVALLLLGCISIHQQNAYRLAGSPAEYKSTLLVGYHLDKVKIDGESVSLLGKGWGTSAWIVEMLPGLHNVEGMWKGKKLSGSFIAEKGINYNIQTDVDEFIDVMNAYILELPPGEGHTLTFEQRMGFTGTQTDETVKKKLKKIANLDFVENVK